MGTLKIAVCDDETVFSEKLKELINEYCEKKQIPYDFVF